MAWISYYMGLHLALVAVLAPVYNAGWDDTRASGIHGVHNPASACCMASRVRRCTAATGE